MLSNLMCYARRYDSTRWPSHLDIPLNLRLVDWLPLNDLLGRNSLLILKAYYCTLYYIAL